ncbi:MAG: hypothetical protein JZU65_16915 [Chlorobium sp.]|nr:hypothetical protein [Chlorobium sp.]
MPGELSFFSCENGPELSLSAQKKEAEDYEQISGRYFGAMPINITNTIDFYIAKTKMKRSQWQGKSLESARTGLRLFSQVRLKRINTSSIHIRCYSILISLKIGDLTTHKYS